MPITMPCHGVVAKTKRWLLENEGALSPALV
jgi:hypothetical protein